MHLVLKIASGGYLLVARVEDRDGAGDWHAGDRGKAADGLGGCGISVGEPQGVGRECRRDGGLY